jgi:hypothetical protein
MMRCLFFLSLVLLRIDPAGVKPPVNALAPPVETTSSER